MAAGRIIIPNCMPALDINGNPVSGAKLTFFVNETTTLLPVYTTAALNVAHPNPISADAAGAFASIFADTDVAYSVAVTDADGAPIVGLRNRDNVKASLFFGDDATTRADLTLSNLSNTATARTNLGVAIGTNVQAYDADLQAIAALTSAADKMPYATGAGTWALADLTSFARTLLATASNSAFLAALGQIAGTAVNFVSSLTGAVTRTMQDKARDILDVRDLGIIADVTDGSRTGTDQTSALVTKLTALGVAGFRGFIGIPYGTRFTVSTVYAAVPVGVTLLDDSSINWGQPTGYKNRFRIVYSSDSISDDSATKFASNHHAAVFLLNMGTAGTEQAAERYASILQGAGIDQDSDDIVGTQLLFSKAAGQDRWATRLKLYTPYDIALANPHDWVTATVYAAGAMCRSDGGKIYETVAGGTSGATAPTGTGTISDGGVTWVYRAAAFTVDSVYLEVTDNGSLVQASPLAETIRHTLSTNGNGVYSEFDPALSRYTIRHIGMSSPIYEVDNGFGIRPAISYSARRLAVTGATPDCPATGAGMVTNGGATNMASMTPVTGRTQATVNLRFDDANTTVVHGAGVNEFRLKGGVNATPPAQGFMTFEMDTAGFGGVWLEVSRSF